MDTCSQKKKEARPPFPCASHSESDSSTDEIPAHILNAQVKYHVDAVDGSPGLHYSARRVQGWTPISPSPALIAGRTRLRTAAEVT